MQARLPVRRQQFSVNNQQSTELFKAGFHMIADDRGSQIAESSAIVCDHMETHFCDRLRSCGNQSSAICDRNVPHNIFNSDR